MISIAEGVKIDRKINLRLTGNSSLANLKSISVGLNGFADAFAELKPEIVVLLGDRFELFAPAISALMLRIPIAHIHGGELSEGAIDDSVRHAITKLASLHFAATEPYRRRIIQMGESPDRVFNFGAPGLDQLYGSTLLSRPQLEQELGFRLQDPIALVTYHPVTRDRGSAEAQVRCLVSAIRASGLKAVFTMANADAQGGLINTRLQAVCAQTPGAVQMDSPSRASPLPELPAALYGHGGKLLQRIDRSSFLSIAGGEYRRSTAGPDPGGKCD